MKKNLRIVSAAAAALLAVAPVAASSVSPVFAAGEAGTATAVAFNPNVVNQATHLNSKDININVAAEAPNSTNHDSVSNTSVTVTLNNLPKGSNFVKASQVYVYKSDDVTPNEDGTVSVKDGTNPVSYFDKGVKYKAVVSVNLTDLTVGGSYSLNGSTTEIKADTTGNLHLQLASSDFTCGDGTLTGSPYVRTKAKDGKPGSVVGNGEQIVFQNTINKIVKAIEDKYEVGVTDKDSTPSSSDVASTTTAATATWPNLKQNVRDAFRNAGITVRSDDDVLATPAAPITVNVSLLATNGKTGSWSFTVVPDPSYGDDTYPQIDYKDNVNERTNMRGIAEISSIGDTSFNYIPLNGYVDVSAIGAAFHARVSATDNTVLPVTVDASKVNTKVLGRYPVVVSATNAAGKTTKVTFYLTVGQKGATYVTVQADTDTIPVYKINGNVVTTTTTTVKNGDQIATFGDPVKVGDKSYTRINGLDSNLFVETKYVDGTVKPVPATPKTIMHNSYIYDKNHKRVGTNKLAAYSTVNVYGTPTKLADGSLAYKIGDNQYVMADNIDGTSRVLSHNAYVYKTSKKRADRRVLKKGATVVTYGSPYTFKNGKAYYRIGGPAKQYVKVANFK